MAVAMTELASYIRRALQISSCQEAVALEDQYDMQEQTLGSRLTNLWSREKTDENTPVVPMLIRGGSDSIFCQGSQEGSAYQQLPKSIWLG
jgi:hypothetical protein